MLAGTPAQVTCASTSSGTGAFPVDHRDLAFQWLSLATCGVVGVGCVEELGEVEAEVEVGEMESSSPGWAHEACAFFMTLVLSSRNINESWSR